jgi:cytochrome P450
MACKERRNRAPRIFRRAHLPAQGSLSDAQIRIPSSMELAVSFDSIDVNDIDVSDPALYQQDIWQPLFTRLRQEAPIHYCAESRCGPYWSVTRYHDIMTVELNHETYSSELGGIQLEDEPANVRRVSFIRMDPPRHAAQRKAVAPVAAPTNLAGYEATIRRRTGAVLDNLRAMNYSTGLTGSPSN